MEQLKNTLNGKIIAILVANGFEQDQMTGIHKSLVDTGAEIKIVSPEKGVVNSWHGKSWGHFFPSNGHLPTCMSHHYDAVVIPGGERHTARLIADPQTARFLRGFMEDEKPVALFEDAAKVLAETGLLENRKVTTSAPVADVVQEKGAVIIEDEIFVEDMLISAINDVNPLVGQFVAAIQSYVPEVYEAA